MNPNIVRLHDLCFDSQYFHSASLRVITTPGTDELDISLVITLFVHNGMRDFGAKGCSILETARMFAKVIEMTGGSQLDDDELAELVTQKTIELNYYKKALEAKRLASS